MVFNIYAYIENSMKTFMVLHISRPFIFHALHHIRKIFRNPKFLLQFLSKLESNSSTTLLLFQAQKSEVAPHSKGPGKIPQPILKGCNVIKEISVSFKAFKKTKIPHERLDFLHEMKMCWYIQDCIVNSQEFCSFMLAEKYM